MLPRPIRVSLLVSLAAAAAWAGMAGGAVAVDLHGLWHEQCAQCHDHAGEFARAHRLGGEGGRAPSVRFLTRHGGGLDPALARGVADMLAAAAATPPRFEAECRVCHGLAARFVRLSLIERDGELVGRYSGRRVADVLAAGHGRVDAAGAAFFTDLLRRLDREVRFAE